MSHEPKVWYPESCLLQTDSTWTFTTSWPEPLFQNMDSCYDIDELLENAKVITTAVEVDSESCQSFYYFKRREAAVSFLKRLNKFIDKETAKVAKYQLLEDT